MTTDAQKRANAKYRKERMSRFIVRELSSYALKCMRHRYVEVLAFVSDALHVGLYLSRCKLRRVPRRGIGSICS